MKMSDEDEERAVRRFKKALERTKSKILPGDILLKKIDAITVDDAVTLPDLGRLIDDLDPGLSHLNDGPRTLEIVMGLFGITAFPLFPHPKRKATYVDGDDHVSRADVAAFFLCLESYGAPVDANDLALSVAKNAMSKTLMTPSELICVWFSRGSFLMKKFERGVGLRSGVPISQGTFKTGTGRKVYVTEGFPNLWVYIPAKRLKPRHPVVLAEHGAVAA